LTVKPESIKPVCFAIDVNPERTWGAIGVAGKREDGKFVGAVIRHDTNPAGGSWTRRAARQGAPPRRDRVGQGQPGELVRERPRSGCASAT
jgi:hypothetical protein